MQNKNYSGRQLGPRWAAQMSSQPSYMHANIKISVGPRWASPNEQPTWDPFKNRGQSQLGPKWAAHLGPK